MMNKKVISKLLLSILLLGMLFQGLAALAATYDQTETTSQTIIEEADNIQSTNLYISDEVQNKIKESDPTNFEKNLTNYKNLLVNLNVHDKFKNEIERLILAGHKLPDILIAYEFLFQNFGHIQDLEGFVLKKESGDNWETIFKDYMLAKPQFIPNTFDTEYLEKLMQTPGLTADDIMIADRVAFESGLSFADLINAKMEGETWQEINSQANLLYSFNQLPRVQITAEQLATFSKSTGLSEQKIVEAFVTATKLGTDAETIINKVKAGYSEAAIFAENYQQKYY